MKQHPDRQPCRAVTVNRRNYNDRETNDEFESERIDLETSVLNND
ncbi:MAG TPA: hypothetical protein VFH15_06020 [Pyrinomonadaceae bacterium]|nr:hypothetical protein [Pyrinomonadaceae bacterium]